MIIIDMRGGRKYKWLAGTFLTAVMLGIILNPLRLTGPNYFLSLVTKTIKLLPIYGVDVPEKKIAISFDATWGAEHTPKILNSLDKYNIKTTFFLVNIWLKKYPEVAKQIVQKGHEIGMHSATHPHFTALTEKQMEEELKENHKMIEEITGQKPFLFRPPFGDYDNTVIKTVDRLGFKTIQWSVDSLDWRDLSAQEIQERVLRQIDPGDIVLFHNNGKYTADALDPIIKKLKEQGYIIVPISELLLKGDYYIDYNGVQRKK
ncbi:MAG: polysaccharide deacetylase family protein [Bacillota bacterium]